MDIPNQPLADRMRPATLDDYIGQEHLVGKGAVIRKITQRLEPRRFSLHTIREPRSAETLLPWMKRYWARLPNWSVQ